MPVPTPALLTLQHHVVLTLHFIWVPKAVALLTEQTASENTALLTSRHQSKVNIAAAKPQGPNQGKSNARLRREALWHGRAPKKLSAANTAAILTPQYAAASYRHFSAHARATDAIKLAFMAGL